MAKNSNSKNPFSGIIGGFILLAIGTVLLWHNEGSFVANMKAVKDVSKNVVEVSSETVDASNEGKLVCLNGDLKIGSDAVTDPVFSISEKTAKLTRVVEIYQWQEKEETENDKTSYTYEKVWSDDLIDSSSFHSSWHENPTSRAYNSEVFCADDVKVGAFSLSKKQIESLSANTEVKFDSTSTIPDGYQIADNYITNSKDVSYPEIGDIRISFKYNNYTEVTVLAVQQKDSFIDYTSDNGKTINRVNSGKMNSKQVLDKMTDENNTSKWIMRIIGAVAVILGYICIISPISKLTSFVPLLGNFVTSTLNLIATLVGIIHSIIIVAIAWFVYRPILSIVLIVVAVGLVIAIKTIMSKNKNNEQPAA